MPTGSFIQLLYKIWLYIINYIVKIPLWITLKIKFNISFKNSRLLYKIKPPYLILSNHVNHWDPLFLASITPHPIRWVTSDAAFRDTKNWVFRAVGAIPKIKDHSDMQTLQELKQVVDKKGVAGIFPEGTQNWDGLTGPLTPATAKLVRFLKVPVVIPLIKGGYLSKPRWAWEVSRGRVEVDIKIGITAEEAASMRISEIEERLRHHLEHDEYAWQRETMVPLKGEQRAEHLELALWTCPSCREMGVMYSEGNKLFCTACGYDVSVNRYGFFEYRERGPAFDSPSAWNRWQRERLKGKIRTALDAAEDPMIMRDGGITLMVGERVTPMRSLQDGEARLYRDRLEFGMPGENPRLFELRDVLAVNVFQQQKLEFRYRRNVYRFRFSDRHVSAYKWETAFRTLRVLLDETRKI